MSNPLKLIEGKKYRVKKSFIDYDKKVHEIGNIWTFVQTNFSAYYDGLTLHVIKENSSTETVYRFQWIKEEQAGIIENFDQYVDLIE